MPWSLVRFHNSGHPHFLTFSCYRRQALLASAQAKGLVEMAIEQARLQYRYIVTGYVVMPEHVHVLLTEPEVGTIATVVQAVKQSVSRKLIARSEHFWQTRYYDFNVRTPEKRMEKLKYIHRNPVKRGLVPSPEDWLWSSYRHYLTGEEGVVGIGLEWKTEPLRVRVRTGE